MKQRILILAAFCTLLLGSCVPNKKIVYLQEKYGKQADTVSQFNAISEDYKLQTNDALQIDIKSTDPNISVFFSQAASVQIAPTAITSSNGELFYLTGTMIDSEGNVDIPMVGKVNVAGQTVEECKKTLEAKLKTYLVNFHLTVRFSGIKYSILGEVRRPGKYTILQNNLTIFEAISNAGDLTEFAKRNDIVVIRTVNGHATMNRVNLLDKSIIGSKFYYVMPNDLIYIVPLKARMFNQTLGLSYLQLLTSVLTTVVLIINLTK